MSSRFVQKDMTATCMRRWKSNTAPDVELADGPSLRIESSGKTYHRNLIGSLPASDGFHIRDFV